MQIPIKPRKRHRSEFLHIRTLRGMNRQDRADFAWADIKRFFKVFLWDINHICQWRKCPYENRIIATFEEASLDHIFPRSLGGRTRLSNLQLMHRDCNSEKSSEPPEHMPRNARVPINSNRGKR